MSTIKHDRDGFLVGELLELSRDVQQAQAAALPLWRSIRSDVKAIARAVGAQVSQARRASQPGSRPASSASRGESSRVASPVGRTSRAVGAASAAAGGAGGSRGPRGAATAGTSGRATATVAPLRDARGRFLAGGRPAPKDGQEGGGAGSPVGLGLDRLSSQVGRLSSSLSAQTDNLDPTFNAVKEVSSVVSPLGRGLSFMFGRGAERKKERWYQRFLKALTAKKPAGEVQAGRGGGAGFTLGLGGGIGGGLIGKMLGGLVGAPLRMLGRGAGGLGALLGRGARGAGGLLKGAGGLLKRLPIIGALLSGGMALGSAFGMFDDPNASPEENRTSRYRGTGQAAGMGVGGAIGAALGSLLGPLGTIGGGWLGALVGEKLGGAFGEWTKSLIDSDLPGRISDSWGAFTTLAGEKWAAFTASAQAAWDGISRVASSLWDAAKKRTSEVIDKGNEAIKNATGVDVKAGVVKGWEATKKAAGAAVDAAAVKAKEVGTTVAEGAKQAWSAAKDAGAAMIPETVKRAWNAVDRWNNGARQDITGAARAAGVDPGLLAKIAHFESGFDSNAKAGSSSAHGYGQFLDATWTEMVNKHGAKYGVAGAGTLTKDQARALRGDTRLQAAMLAEFTKENQAKGKAYGGADDAANVYAFHNLGDGDAKRFLTGMNQGMSVRDALVGGRSINEKERARIEAVISNNRGLYGDGTISAADAYKRMGQKMAAGERFAVEARAQPVGAAPVPVASSSPTIQAPSVASVPSTVPAKIAPQPEYQAPPDRLNGAGQNIMVTTPPAPVAQNVGDRGLAHIVTGGIGAVG